jgi:hypothetical protein
MLARSPPQLGRIYFFAMDRTFIDPLASESDHRRAKELAQSALDGRTTVLEAEQSERWLLWHTRTQLLMGRIGSSSLGLKAKPIIYPLERFASSGASSALNEKDVEIARAEELYRADFLEMCRRIVQPESPVRE